jgi:hypothetical protein
MSSPQSVTPSLIISGLYIDVHTRLECAGLAQIPVTQEHLRIHERQAARATGLVDDKSGPTKAATAQAAASAIDLLDEAGSRNPFKTKGTTHTLAAPQALKRRAHGQFTAMVK